MKREQLKSSPTGELVLIDPSTDEPHVKYDARGNPEPDPVTVFGYTPDSDEWRKIERRVLGPGKKQDVWLDKDKGAKVEVDSDTAEKRHEIVIRSISKIDNVEDLGDSPEELYEFLSDPLCGWIVEQWEKYLTNRGNYYGSRAKKLARGSKPTAG